MNFYLLREGSRSGPFTIQQIAGFIRGSECKMTDMAWHEGMREWSPLHSFPDIVDVILPPIPTPPQSASISEALIITAIPASRQQERDSKHHCNNCGKALR